MPHNKKQHYVPHFYLKRFSPDDRSICLWNIKNEVKVKSANLRNQCYKHYFYGKDLKLEHFLGEIENHTARIFRLIDDHNSLSQLIEEDRSTLMFYILAQHGRTTYSADDLDDGFNKFMQHICMPEVEAKGIDLSKYTIHMNDVAQHSLTMALKTYPLMCDLKCKLLLNETSVEFVTSDNPLVLYNQLLSFRQPTGNTGLASKGLQVFLPIDSNKTLLFYDNQSYSVGTKNKPIVKITSPKDVYELNTLQMTSAYKNLYYENVDFDMIKLFRKASPFRRQQKSRMSEFSRKGTKNSQEFLIAMSKEDVRTNLKLSFIRITQNSKIWRNKFRDRKMQPAIVVRNEQLLEDYDEFWSMIDNKEYSSVNFFDFLDKKYDKNDN